MARTIIPKTSRQLKQAIVKANQKIVDAKKEGSGIKPQAIGGFS